jgi:hypothetical protein
LVASEVSIRRDTAHTSAGSEPSIRCDRGVSLATLTAAGALTSDLVTEAHRQNSTAHQIELLDLVVEVTGALLEVRVRGDPDEGHRQLPAPQRLGEAAKLARNVGRVMWVVDLVGLDDGVAGGLCRFAGHGFKLPGPGRATHRSRPSYAQIRQAS